MILLYSSILLFVVYATVVLFYWIKWKAVPFFSTKPLDEYPKVSVVIPARNEEQHIGKLLTALQQQDYPADFFEIIVIDDHSTDHTADIVKRFPDVRVIEMKDDAINSYKKKAIETGIAVASGDWIVTTDADCIPGKSWLTALFSFQQQTHAVFIAAPVKIECNSSVLEVFQAIDFMVLQGITGAVVHHQLLSMCNGANLAYTKKAFYEVNGFAGIDSIASGDDMLLMYKMAKQYPGRIHFLKAGKAIVATEPMKTWKAFFQQRIRWASKATQYQDKRIFPVLLLVYLFNLSFLFLLGAACWDLKWGAWLLIMLAAKTIVELPLFISVARFFDKQWSIKWFPLFQPLHILYTIASGFFGQIGKYEWKGRKVH